MHNRTDLPDTLHTMGYGLRHCRYLPDSSTADTSDFAGSVRCDAVGEGLFSAVALEMDPGNRIFTTLPVTEMPSQE